MTTQPLAISIVSAPIASLDRRALSQAWYSALHLAKDQSHDELPLQHSHRSPARTLTSGCGNGSRSNVIPLGASTIARREMQPPRSIVAHGDRRALRSPLARKIERAFLHPSRPMQRATFTVDAAGSRVQVSLQTTSAGTRLVALCAPHVRERVARALDEARYALAARGIPLYTVIDGADS